MASDLEQKNRTVAIALQLSELA